MYEKNGGEALLEESETVRRLTRIRHKTADGKLMSNGHAAALSPFKLARVPTEKKSGMIVKSFGWSIAPLPVVGRLISGQSSRTCR